MRMHYDVDTFVVRRHAAVKHPWSAVVAHSAGSDVDLLLQANPRVDCSAWIAKNADNCGSWTEPC